MFLYTIAIPCLVVLGIWHSDCTFSMAISLISTVNVYHTNTRCKFSHMMKYAWVYLEMSEASRDPLYDGYCLNKTEIGQIVHFYIHLIYYFLSIWLQSKKYSYLPSSFLISMSLTRINQDLFCLKLKCQPVLIASFDW